MIAIGSSLLLLALLYVLMGFFCAAEAAFTSASYSWLKEQADSGNATARTAYHFVQHIGAFLGTVLFGTNILSISIATLSRALVVTYLLHTRAVSALVATLHLGHNAGDLLASCLVTPTVLLFSEMIPKAIARQRADQATLLLAPPLRLAAALFHPFVTLLDKISERLTHHLAVSGQDALSQSKVSREDLRILAEVATEQGLVPREAGEMFQTVLDLDNQTVGTIMVPLSEVRALPVTASMDDLEALAIETGFTRFPVYEKRMDDIIGIVSYRECLHNRYTFENSSNRPNIQQPIADFVDHNVLFVPEFKTVSTLLAELRRRHTPMAVVIDEYGGMVGLTTIEDLAEEIVGDFHRLTGGQSPDALQWLDTTTCECSGQTDIRQLEPLFGVPMDNLGVETAAGFVLKQLDRIPEPGDAFRHRNVTVTVIAMQRHRITRLRFTK